MDFSPHNLAISQNFLNGTGWLYLGTIGLPPGRERHVVTVRQGGLRKQNVMSQYLRCKRKNQTVFLHVETFTTFQEIKKQLAENFSMEPEKIMLWANDKVCFS